MQGNIDIIIGRHGMGKFSQGNGSFIRFCHPQARGKTAATRGDLDNAVAVGFLECQKGGINGFA